MCVLEDARAERFFQKNSSWYEKIPANPKIKSNSAEAIKAIRNMTPYISIYNPLQPWPGEYNVPVFYAGKDTPYVTVPTTDSYPSILGWNKVPIPPEAVPAGNEYMLKGNYRDGHMVIISHDRKYAWEFFMALKKKDGAFTATRIRKWDLRGDGVEQPYWCQEFPDNNGKPAQYCLYNRVAALPLLHGLITYNEVQKGYIDHAIAFGMPNIGNEAVYPVEIRYGNTKHCGKKMCGGMHTGWYGYRFQLDPAFNCETYSPLKGNQVICKALQEYGMIFVENTGSGISLYLEDLDNQPGKSWNGIVSNFVGGIPT
ncbi:MAG: hypothetical protein HY756_11605, partial [Nitrospirae bacterium]|nr:hypothetical protein [Nitrospirota bacterium]